jgi:predicted outer membrane repeat protein
MSLFLESLESRVVPATLAVNTFQDTVNATGILSLRDAITIVNGGAAALQNFNLSEQEQVSGALGSNDTIVFDSSVFSVTRTIALGSALPGLSKTGETITIQGSGSNLLTLDGQKLGFTILSVNANVTASISGLTLYQGSAATGTNGGAISSQGNLTISNCVFSNDRAPQLYSESGAIYNGVGTLVVTGCPFDHCQSVTGGGAISNHGVAYITDSAFTSDLTGIAAYNSSGGAIYNVGTATISDCSFVGNTSNARGGAISSASGSFNVSAADG